jgi:Ca2+-binding RTX toxin-like protein
MHSNSPATPININAGAGDDTMLMLPTLSAAGLKLDGQGGTNSLDYSAYASDIFVNLASGQATNVGGGIANFHNVTGGAGSDILVGSDQANTLSGNAGRDLLFGGLAGDALLGGLDDDLLVGGTTTHTTFAAFNALRSEWKRLDADYATRIAHLTSGGGLNGATLLNLATVPSDGMANRLSGQQDLDWFFANLLDSTDLDPLAEQQVTI